MANEKRLIDANALSSIAFQIAQYGKGIRCVVDLDEVDDIPTVDAVEVVHGRWLYDSGTGHYFCSACNEEAFHTSIDKPVYDYDWEENLRYSHTDTIYEEHLTDYCPHCGAKMDGDGNA